MAEASPLDRMAALKRMAARATPMMAARFGGAVGGNGSDHTAGIVAGWDYYTSNNTYNSMYVNQYNSQWYNQYQSVNQYSSVYVNTYTSQYVNSYSSVASYSSSSNW